MFFLVILSVYCRRLTLVFWCVCDFRAAEDLSKWKQHCCRFSSESFSSQ